MLCRKRKAVCYDFLIKYNTIQYINTSRRQNVEFFIVALCGTQSNHWLQMFKVHEMLQHVPTRCLSVTILPTEMARTKHDVCRTTQNMTYELHDSNRKLGAFTAKDITLLPHVIRSVLTLASFEKRHNNFDAISSQTLAKFGSKTV
jgi:hypothetical protein